MRRLRTTTGIRFAVIPALAWAAFVGVTVTYSDLPATSIERVADEHDPATLYNRAQKQFADRDAAGGLTDLAQMLALSPQNADALALQAIWSEHVDDAATRDAALERLAQADPNRERTARNVIDGVNFAAQIVPSTQPVPADASMAIVVLGFGLMDNGTMRPELISRLSAGLLQANTTPDVPIVVTGGNPKRGISEGAAMKKWLLDQGVPETRIILEDKAPSTVGNAQNTTVLLQERGISNIVLVTSPNHIRRAAADFAGAGTRVVGTVTTDTDLDANLAPYSREQQAGIRLEATRTAGLPTSKPEGSIKPEPDAVLVPEPAPAPELPVDLVNDEPPALAEVPAPASDELTALTEQILDALAQQTGSQATP